MGPKKFLRFFHPSRGFRSDTEIRRSPPVTDNPLKLKSIHHVEFWVGNARQAAYFYRQAFGFSQIAYAGLETGQRDRTCYALTQGKARLLLSSPLDSSGAIAEHTAQHGDAV